jgi:hypothetical protein
MPAKIDIVPFEAEQFAHSQACPEGQEDKSALANTENSNEPLNFACAKYRGNSFSLCALSYELNRVPIADVVSNSVIEDYAHEIPDLGTA